MSGLVLGASLPERWSATDGVRWAVDVPGQGWSSPIVAGGVVYLTSAISNRPFKQPTPGIYGNDYIAELRAAGLSNDEVNARLRARDNELPEESDAIRYMVYAFDARTGALKWEREAYHGLPIGGRQPQEHVRLGNALFRHSSAGWLSALWGGLHTTVSFTPPLTKAELEGYWGILGSFMGHVNGIQTLRPDG